MRNCQRHKLDSLLVLVCLVLLLTTTASAEPIHGGPSRALFLQPDTAQLAGEVTTMTHNSTTLYMSGTISSIGPLTGSLASLNPSNGATLPGMPVVNGTISAILPDPSGGWFIGGNF